jgi:hypothetical protein
MNENILYSDGLIEIGNDSIVFHNYYFPTTTAKTVKFDEIETIFLKTPTIINGKYRYWGSGDFIHWFPLDTKRSKRDTIFILHRKNKRIKICFTVEDSEKVIGLLKDKVTLNKT